MGEQSEDEPVVDEHALAEILRGKVTGDEALDYARGKKSAEPHPLGDYDEVVSHPGALLRFRKEGNLHRLDGPALCHPDTGVVQFVVEHRVYNPLDHLVLRGLLTPGYDRSESLDIELEATSDASFYYDLVTCLEDGAPLEWAIAYARGEVTT